MPLGEDDLSVRVAFICGKTDGIYFLGKNQTRKMAVLFCFHFVCESSKGNRAS